MVDRAAIEQSFREDNPFFTVRSKILGSPATEYTVDPDELPEEYEEILQDKVDSTVSHMEQEISDGEGALLRRQFVTGMGKLRSNLEVLKSTSTTQMNWSVMTAAQRQEATRIALVDLHQDLLWLGNILRNSGIFTPEDEGA